MPGRLNSIKRASQTVPTPLRGNRWRLIHPELPHRQVPGSKRPTAVAVSMIKLEQLLQENVKDGPQRQTV